jgi:hypothetical protein
VVIAIEVPSSCNKKHKMPSSWPSQSTRQAYAVYLERLFDEEILAHILDIHDMLQKSKEKRDLAVARGDDEAVLKEEAFRNEMIDTLQGLMRSLRRA